MYRICSSTGCSGLAQAPCVCFDAVGGVCPHASCCMARCRPTVRVMLCRISMSRAHMCCRWRLSLCGVSVSLLGVLQGLHSVPSAGTSTHAIYIVGGVPLVWLVRVPVGRWCGHTLHAYTFACLCACISGSDGAPRRRASRCWCLL